MRTTPKSLRSWRRCSALITRLTAQWQDEATAFHKRSLADTDYVDVWVDGIHLKVGLEQDKVGRYRRRHLTPVPVAASLVELNAMLAAADLADQDRHVAGRAETVGQAVAREQLSLRRCPSTRSTSRSR